MTGTMIPSDYVPSESIPDLMTDLQIGSDFEKECREQASRFATWGTLHVQAKANVRQREELLELKFFELYSQYRANNKGDKDQKENDAKAFVHKHPAYKEAQRRLRLAKSDVDTFRVAVDSFKDRASMLQQIGPAQRQERQYTQSTPSLSNRSEGPERSRPPRRSTPQPDRFPGEKTSVARDALKRKRASNKQTR